MQKFVTAVRVTLTHETTPAPINPKNGIYLDKLQVIWLVAGLIDNTGSCHRITSDVK